MTRTYEISNTMPHADSILSVQSDNVQDVIKKAERLYKCPGPTMWTHRKSKSNPRHHRWTQFRAVKKMATRTGLRIDLVLKSHQTLSEADVALLLMMG